jgi:hypothetical protein
MTVLVRSLLGGTIACVCLAVAPLAAQETLPPLQIGVFGGFAPRGPIAFSSDQLCTTRRAFPLGGRLSFLLSHWLVAEAGAEAFLGQSHQDCIDAPTQPPPPQGPFTRTSVFYQNRYTGYPFVQTGVRLSVIPLARPGVDLRVSAGVARAWARHTWALETAVTTQLGRGYTRALIEFGLLRYSVPLTTLRQDYLDGQLIGSQSTDRPVRTLSPILRLGIAMGNPAGLR